MSLNETKLYLEILECCEPDKLDRMLDLFEQLFQMQEADDKNLEIEELLADKNYKI